ncbi:deoxyguanosinetriphosphate triphosphohydrolase [Actinoplanes teichomyceticus]|uniref:Deoxyguanosinetriphosphate triphosphohydrolase-like protein n=1 Tax=Actinoplanes teichomyceticus TaxID=1867 RepID=A0A561WI86_ACTTI|nr:deoxyguanosinetriphosphate triphosphohydrolase [Actinoplanes teichomyceticus]TWG23564.1 dGTPase [Actinoplanes teichomyceticus]GIF16188.1 deoxyguanosinetriphosphate triphosphohydrolase-like protein [Actinoplanes teichomyceticus]
MTASDAQRWVSEPAKDSGYGRTPYQRDRARVLHSAGFRRLAAKTQVHTAGSDDFLRTRLTHSLEVAQISREMGARLGCDPDVVDVAGLAHDIGHPPFGHNGEAALDQVAGACGGFEGNAQTLRVLTRLEAKVPGAGLNLTRASLDACAKYPWFRRPGARKFGVYADDEPVFSWLRAGRADDRRCLEAQVMDWADDVAYSVHDVEDGVHGGYLDLGLLLRDPVERAELCADVAATYSDETPDRLGEALDRLLADPAVAAAGDYDGSYPAQIALKRMTSVLTGRFVSSAVGATHSRYGTEPMRRYQADLVVPATARDQCALLKGMAFRYVMRTRAAEQRYQRQRTVLIELVEALGRTPERLDPLFRPCHAAARTDADALRVIVDQVASLTDHAAVAWHRALVAQR